MAVETAIRDDTDAVEVPAIRWRVLVGVGGALAVVLVSLGGRYGYYRDELYYVLCGRHPAWGYPDQPPLTPVLARLTTEIGNGSLTIFRLPCAVAMVTVAVVAGLIARELGGERFAQLLAAIACATGMIVLLAGHVLVTLTIDLPVWVVTSWLVVRLLRTRDERLWLAIGVVTAVGLLNKQLPLVFLLGLGVGMLLSPAARPLLLSRWMLLGGLVAAVAWAPVLAWQAGNGWPQFTLAREIGRSAGGLDARVGFLVVQLMLFSLGATYLWMTGLLRLWRDPRWRVYRPLAWAWVVVMVFFLLTGAQIHYAAGTYPVLIAAGAVAIERRLRARLIALVAVCVTALLTVPATLPVLSPTALAASPWAGLGQIQLDSVGWPGFVEQVAAAYRSIPAAQRADAVIFTANYAEAGAIDMYGPDLGLPPAYSGHNALAAWGPPASATAFVVVVWDEEPPDAFFSGCRMVGQVQGPVGNQETDRASISVCAGPKGGWTAVWPSLSHLD
jgi:hypothetical protein